MRGRHLEPGWAEFAAWCRERRLRALPAHPWTVAAYARWCERRHRLASIMLRIRSIARVHLLACLPSPDRHPTVTQTLRLLETRYAARAERSGRRRGEDPSTQGPALTAAAKPAARTRRGSGRRLRSTPRLISRRPG